MTVFQHYDYEQMNYEQMNYVFGVLNKEIVKTTEAIQMLNCHNYEW